MRQTICDWCSEVIKDGGARVKLDLPMEIKEFDFCNLICTADYFNQFKSSKRVI